MINFENRQYLVNYKPELMLNYINADKNMVFFGKHPTSIKSCPVPSTDSESNNVEYGI